MKDKKKAWFSRRLPFPGNASCSIRPPNKLIHRQNRPGNRSRAFLAVPAFFANPVHVTFEFVKNNPHFFNMYFLFVSLLALHPPFLAPGHPEKSSAAAEIVLQDSAVNVRFADGNLETARLQFEDSLVHLYNAMDLSRYGLAFDAFRYGMIGYGTLQQQGRLSNKKLLTIIDFTKPSTEKRFYTLDLSELRVAYYTYVSHGKNSGENNATTFSNVLHSNQSSMGFFATGETYIGGKGFSLKLDGLERGYNDNARERAVVIHEAEYVSEYWIRKYGRLGRSQGCPALPKELSKEIIQTIKNNTLIFAYFNDDTYLQSSPYLNPAPLISSLPASVHNSAE
jgi:hypothetical protein